MCEMARVSAGPWRQTFWFVGRTIAIDEVTALGSDPVVTFARQARGLSHGPWRQTSRFVGAVVVTTSSSSRSFASQAGSLRHERGGPFSPSPQPSPAATRVLFTGRRFAGEGVTRGLRRCSVWTVSDGGSAGGPVAHVVSVHRRDSVANSFRVESWVGDGDLG